MRFNQNRIELQLRCGYYEEFMLEPEDTAILLPGSLVSISRAYCSDPCYVSSHGHLKADDTYELVNLELLVVIENALVGTGINSRQTPGEAILARRALPGDIYLLRAVAGTYTTGTPVYATQTDNGIYVSPNGKGRFVGYAEEDFVITPDMVGPYETSTWDRPMKQSLNGKLFNLLRVRIDGAANAKRRTIRYNVTVNSYADNENKAVINLKFLNKLDVLPVPEDFEIPEANFIVNEISPVAGSELLFTVAVTILDESESIEFSLNTEAVVSKTKTLVINPVGFWGVCYTSLTDHSQPTADDIVKLEGKTPIINEKRTISVDYVLNKNDWERVYNEYKDVTGLNLTYDINKSGRAFLITKNWGNATNITTYNGVFPLDETFEGIVIVINGITYTGHLSKSDVVYDGATYTFNF